VLRKLWEFRWVWIDQRRDRTYRTARPMLQMIAEPMPAIGVAIVQSGRVRVAVKITMNVGPALRLRTSCDKVRLQGGLPFLSRCRDHQVNSCGEGGRCGSDLITLRAGFTVCIAINVKPPLLIHRCHGRLTTPFMVQRRSTRTDVPRLGPCLTALRVLASSNGPHRGLVERQIDEYLRNDPFSLAHALERLRRAIQYEELERREGEDWSVAKEYVRSLLRRMT
jgi:hypothetical protein